jgi:hypothetical protein
VNIVPIAGLVRWGVAAFFLCAAGLSYVYVKNQMQTTGAHIRDLEQTLSTLTMQDDTERAQIAGLTSQPYLERRLAEGFIQLVPITEDRIVRIHLTAGRTQPAEDTGEEFQPVSNRIVAQ